MDSFVPILLQKSFCTGDRKFCGPWTRLSCKDVRDLIALRQTHRRLWVMRLRIYESATTSRSVFLRKICGPATFEFCNKICQLQTCAVGCRHAAIRVGCIARNALLRQAGWS